MLFKTRFSAGLRDGSVDLTFRRWSRPQVKVGGVYFFDRAPGGLVVDALDKVPVGKISTREAKRAGFDSINDLKAALRVKGSPVTGRTSVYRIAFHYDPSQRRPSAPVASSAADIEKLIERLRMMDRLSRRGPWTKQVLGLIAKHPQRRAGDLAPILDRESRSFKADVRKLKGMGLTTSFEIGYELTPTGRRVLDLL